MDTQPPPFDVTLFLSSPTISLSGDPPFIATTVYTCTTLRPIYALISLFSDFGDHLEVRDPNRGRLADKRIGVVPTMVFDDWDEENLDFIDSRLVHVNPGEKVETTYTFSVVPKAKGLRRSDTASMKESGEYTIELGKRKCWWIDAKEMVEGMGEQEKKEMLRQRGSCLVWRPTAGKTLFKAVA
ncbi:hypothetical protein P153DRAFT_398421 [Dothidotthia symphoricarpi CBS 119687]|uniref:Uncharacterized protein n=1 Tax=Dothidotthia symphoricarpi CBS 119687 TaxID=1392245 RepID=A0A6A6A898_9PLEO|nr:uncharacterized protein P153DRAFT_398421 [Dothidotthia symphoricarpi CBS 119687]KAF2127047.1 hypothetical protein P153DRAFT_398421 [Dothidotthia symphoricarpi CBS 119687]